MSTLALVAGVSLAGCGGQNGDGPSAPRPEVTGPTAVAPGCRAGPRTAVPDGVRALPNVVIGMVDGQRLQRGRSTDGRSFGKAGLFVRGAASVRIDVPTGQGASAVAIQGWSVDASAVIRRRAVVRPRGTGTCPLWTPFPGGLVYRHARCARVRIASEGRTAFVTFGLGRGCPPNSP